MMNVPLLIESSPPRTFKFGSQRKKSIGATEVKVLYGQDKLVLLRLDVIEVNIPILLGLDTLDKFKMYVNNVLDLLTCMKPPWEQPITRKNGHLFYEWERLVLYTDTELRRIHRHV